MAVVSCELSPKSIQRRAVFTAPVDAQYTTGYLIVSDDINDNQLTVAEGATTSTPDPLPGLGDTFANDVNSFVKRIELVNLSENRLHWHATVHWMPREPGESFNPNPLLRDDVDWWEYNDVEEEVKTDKDGNQIVNNAKMPFPDPIIQRFRRGILVLKKNYATREEIDNLNDTYGNTTNNATWKNKNAKTWKYLSTTSSPKRTENGIDYFQGTTRIEFNKDTWVVTLQEVSWEHFDVAAGNLVKPVGDDGLEFADPVKLAADGTRLADGTDPLETTFDILNPVDYSVMGFGS